MVLHFYVRVGEGKELCFNVDAEQPLKGRRLRKLKSFFRGKPFDQVHGRSRLKGRVIEIGRRPQMPSPYSSQAVALLQMCGLPEISRVEVSTRYILPEGVDEKKFIEDHCDFMVEQVYAEPLRSFVIDLEPAPVVTVPVIGESLELINAANQKYSMGLNEQWMRHFYDLFAKTLKREPTDLELSFIREAISNHSFHWLFHGIPVIDGVRQEKTLWQLIKAPWENNPKNSVIAFHDNASAVQGAEAMLLVPDNPTRPSKMVWRKVLVHPSLTCETHCYPTFVCPWPGAETGIGGCFRDSLAIGRGGEHSYAIAGFFTGNLFIPGYEMPWEDERSRFNSKAMASPLKIMLEAPGGAWAYGNPYGVPVIQGATRTYGMIMSNGEHYSYFKPIMFAGLAGVVRDEHITKNDPKKGMVVVQIGGPAYPVGFGGGSGSSDLNDEAHAERDYNAVQRGDALKAQGTWRAIRACVELGLANIIQAIHDQGAAGILNVLSELIGTVGGKIFVRKVNVGDKTMSVLQICLAEYQERYGILVRCEDLDILRVICERENCPLEVLGEITGDGRFVVYDEKDGTNPIDLPFGLIRDGLEPRELHDVSPADLSSPVQIPDDLDFGTALRNVLRTVVVGSKAYLVNRVDTTVGGRVVQSQACGPLHLPVSDVAVTALGFTGITGQASAIGECSPKMMLDPRAGARMAAAEMISNLMAVEIDSHRDIKASINWMWPAKDIQGGLAKLYFAMQSLSEFLIEFGIAADGGKDSTSLAAKVGGELVKSPETLMVTGYAYVPDTTKVLTPDVKCPGESVLILIDNKLGMFSGEDYRLGGSVFLQTLGQLGDQCPDAKPGELQFIHRVIGRLHRKGLIQAYHDRSDGGLITCILEMLFAGNCGADIHFNANDYWSHAFAEETGHVVEVKKSDLPEFEKNLFHLNYTQVATTKESQDVRVFFLRSSGKDEQVFSSTISELRGVWSETSHEIEKLQINPALATCEWEGLKSRKAIPYSLTFDPDLDLPPDFFPKVAVLRTIGTNGDREMIAALKIAGFEAWDVNLVDLIKGVITLDGFQGLVIPGGFSWMDVFGAGKGLASILADRLRKMFEGFLARSDSFFLGVCNGCQVGAYLGVAPFGSYDKKRQPLFLRNDSDAFESRFVGVKILESPSIMFHRMEGSILSVPVAHGEGKLWVPQEKTLRDIFDGKLATMAYVDDRGEETQGYPFNPNGSPFGWTGLCDPTGRFNIMMPHPERAFLPWQWQYIPDWMKGHQFAPWIRMFQNTRVWCEENRVVLAA